MLDYMRWNGNDSLLISFELCFMNGNEYLIDEILSWLFIVIPLDWYPSWFSSQRYGSSVYGRCTGYDHTLPLGTDMDVTVLG